MAHSHDRPSERLARSSAIEGRPAGDGGAVVPPQSGGDPLSDVLRTVRLTGALFFLVDATSPWGVEVPHADEYAAIILPQARHVLSYHIVLEGGGWASLSGDVWVRFEAGDIMVFPHADPYAMLSQPGDAPEFDAAATVRFFREMAAGRMPFVVPEGGGGPERMQLVCGYLGCDMQPFNPVLSALPRLLRIPRPERAGDDLLDRLVELTLAEAQNPRAGGESIRLRLSELLFVEVVRRHLANLPEAGQGWFSALRDPGIGRALTLLHDRPAQAWTLQDLSEAAGLSRAVLAVRFKSLVGCPPMLYLTRWRMQVAARLLADSARSVAGVGHEVGYESEAAFSRAFKKLTGSSPAAWRRLRRG